MLKEREERERQLEEEIAQADVRPLLWAAMGVLVLMVIVLAIVKGVWGIPEEFGWWFIFTPFICIAAVVFFWCAVMGMGIVFMLIARGFQWLVVSIYKGIRWIWQKVTRKS